MIPGTILIVEDDPVVRMLTEKQVSALGSYRVKTVSTGEAALELISDDIALIFMDVGLPGIDGLNVTLHIRQQELAHGFKHIPIVALTGHGDKDKCLAGGMDDFLQKPALLADIRSMLNKYLPADRELQPPSGEPRMMGAPEMFTAAEEPGIRGTARNADGASGRG
jgi:CheY-like chemotaxis protein